MAQKRLRKRDFLRLVSSDPEGSFLLNLYNMFAGNEKSCFRSYSDGGGCLFLGNSPDNTPMLLNFRPNSNYFPRIVEKAYPSIGSVIYYGDQKMPEITMEYKGRRITRKSKEGPTQKEREDADKEGLPHPRKYVEFRDFISLRPRDSRGFVEIANDLDIYFELRRKFDESSD